MSTDKNSWRLFLVLKLLPGLQRSAYINLFLSDWLIYIEDVVLHFDCANNPVYTRKPAVLVTQICVQQGQQGQFLLFIAIPFLKHFTRSETACRFHNYYWKHVIWYTNTNIKPKHKTSLRKTKKLI